MSYWRSSGPTRSGVAAARDGECLRGRHVTRSVMLAASGRWWPSGSPDPAAAGTSSGGSASRWMPSVDGCRARRSRLPVRATSQPPASACPKLRYRSAASRAASGSSTSERSQIQAGPCPGRRCRDHRGHDERAAAHGAGIAPQPGPGAVRHEGSGHQLARRAQNPGGSDDGRRWTQVNAGLPRLSIGALATDPSDGSVWVGTGEANNASENQYGVGVFRLAQGSSTWQQVGGARAGRLRLVPHRLDQRLRLRRDEPRPVPPRRRRDADPALATRARPGGRARLPAELVGHRRPGGARDERRAGAGGRRLGRLQRAAGRRSTTASTSAPAPPAASRRITPTGDINPNDHRPHDVQRRRTAGCTRSCRTPPTTTCAARASSCPSRATRPARGRGSPTPTSSPTPAPHSATRPAPTTRASSPTTTRTSSPTRRTASTSTCSWRRSSSPPTAARPGGRSAPYWNYDISCDADDNTPYAARARRTRTSTRG